MCAYRQPPNLMRILVKSNLSKIPRLVCNNKCMKPRCQVCDILDTRNKLQIPGTSSIIQPGNYNCDSCNIVYWLMCSNVTLEITSEWQLTDYDLDWIIIKWASETTAGVSRWLFISTYPTIRLKIWDVLFWEATSKRRQTDSFVNKRWYINSKHIQKVLIKIYHFYRRIATFTSVDHCTYVHDLAMLWLCWWSFLKCINVNKKS